jgi:capsular exopolysaccharide synthesis family protein
LAESFRNLRTNIQFADVKKPVKTIMVTSAGPGEGKSTVLANLAVTMAHAGQKVLLIDCDLRKPVLHRVFSLENKCGMTNLLLDQCALEEAVQPTFVENLFVVTSGPIPPNPSEMLGSKQFGAVLEHYAGGFDRVLIDSSPAGVVTDSMVLARQVDGVIMAVYAEKAKVDQVKYVKEQMAKADAYMLGVVLTHVPKNGRTYQYYYNYYEED